MPKLSLIVIDRSAFGPMIIPVGVGGTGVEVGPGTGVDVGPGGKLPLRTIRGADHTARSPLGDPKA